MSGWFLFLLPWCIITATNVLGLITQWFNTYFTFSLKKKNYFCCLLFWILEVTLPCQKVGVRFLLAYKFDYFFWPLEVLQGFVVDFLLFSITLQHYATVYQSNTNWCGITIKITTVPIMPSLRLDKCGEGVLKGIVCLVLVSHLCNWLKV